MGRKILHKMILIKNGITQRQVAEMLHYSESYVSMLISGERKCKRFDKFIEGLANLDNEDV